MASASNFREVFLDALDRGGGRDGRTAAGRMKKKLGPIRQALWNRIEKKVAAEYTQATGAAAGAGFDWRRAFQWLVDNLPTILKIIAPLLMLI